MNARPPGHHPDRKPFPQCPASDHARKYNIHHSVGPRWSHRRQGQTWVSSPWKFPGCPGSVCKDSQRPQLEYRIRRFRDTLPVREAGNCHYLSKQGFGPGLPGFRRVPEACSAIRLSRSEIGGTCGPRPLRTAKALWHSAGAPRPAGKFPFSAGNSDGPSFPAPGDTTQLSAIAAPEGDRHFPHRRTDVQSPTCSAATSDH